MLGRWKMAGGGGALGPLRRWKVGDSKWDITAKQTNMAPKMQQQGQGGQILLPSACVIFSRILQTWGACVGGIWEMDTGDKNRHALA